MLTKPSCRLQADKRAGLPKTTPLQAVGRLIGLPRSAWGLFFGHLGMAIAVAGVTAISVWKVEAIQTLKPGETVSVSAYDFTLLEVASGRGPNYQTSVAAITVSQAGADVATLQPERRWYPVERQPTTEAGIETLWHGDLYAVLGDPDGLGGWVTRFYYNPGVAWMWLGALLMGVGGLLSVSDRRLRVGAPRRASKRALGRAAASLCLTLALMAPGAAIAIDADEMFEDSAKEARALDIGKQLRCLVCQNQSIFDSNAGLARDLRLVVRERIEAGDSDEEVMGYIVDRYGDYVLLEPPLRARTFLLWSAPLLLLLTALVTAGFYLRRRVRPEELSADERAEAKRLLGETAP